mmetsp:Transcript_5578/g.19172  ORF Transcript_5578/g.19172 Transcript_5578/m.19172 type:complete len:305 (-) Transcript_5578:673-1587(-)
MKIKLESALGRHVRGPLHCGGERQGLTVEHRFLPRARALLLPHCHELDCDLALRLVREVESVASARVSRVEDGGAFVPIAAPHKGAIVHHQLRRVLPVDGHFQNLARALKAEHAMREIKQLEVLVHVEHLCDARANLVVDVVGTDAQHAQRRVLRDAGRDEPDARVAQPVPTQIEILELVVGEEAVGNLLNAAQFPPKRELIPRQIERRERIVCVEHLSDSHRSSDANLAMAEVELCDGGVVAQSLGEVDSSSITDAFARFEIDVRERAAQAARSDGGNHARARRQLCQLVSLVREIRRVSAVE